MQISKCFLVVCAVAFCATPLLLRAAESDADIKLREALEKKLNELQTQPAAATPKPAAPTAPAAAPAPAAQPAPIVAPTPEDSEAIAKAREALRQKMMELQTPSGARPTPPAQGMAPPAAHPSPPVAQPTAPAPAVPPAQPAPTPAPAVQTAPNPGLVAPTPADAEAIAKAREALRQKMRELEAPPWPALAAPPEANSESIAKAREALRQKMKELEQQPPALAPAPAPSPAVALTKPPEKPAEIKPEMVTPAPPTVSKKRAKGMQPFPPIQGPPPAISAEKEQRLAELLRKYKADEITPEQYHEQRAKILSEP